jgi:type IV pilus assembly protein PilM
VEAIRRAIVEANAEGWAVVTALSGASVAMQLLVLPAMPAEDLYSVMPYRAQEVMPIDVRRSRFDFTVVSQVDHQVRVLAVAAPDAEVDRTVALVHRAGIAVKAVDVDALAVVNCFLEVGPVAAGSAWGRGTVGLLHIGASLTSLAVLTEGALDFCRQIVIGTEAVAATETALDDLAHEIRLSLEYRQAQGQRPVDCVVLGGGGASLAGGVDVFEDVLGVPVLPWDPTEMVEVSAPWRQRLRPIAPQLVVGLGLALRGVQGG